MFALDLRRHLLQHRDQSSQAPFEPRLAREISLRRNLLFQLLRRDHALMQQRLNGFGLLLLPVIALPRGCDLQAEIVEMLLHCAQLGLAGRLRIPPHQRLDTGLHGVVRLHADQVADETEHEPSPRLVAIKPEP